MAVSSRAIRAKVRARTRADIHEAVRRHSAFSRAGMLDRLFAWSFQGLVYPQIWEDPVVDMAALAIGPGDRIATIASGSCNVLSYLTAGPERIDAVDLNGAHVALGRLKLAALAAIPDHATFLRLFGEARSPANVRLYDHEIAPRLDPVSRAYWEACGLTGRRNIEAFATGFYRRGLLGRFIGAAHLLARLYGADLGTILRARTLAEQRAVFDREIAPLFGRAPVRWLLRQPASLYGLGIPPAQFRALAGDDPGGIAAVLKARLERLACGFEVGDNYFAAQAFGRGYAAGPAASLPPYLQPAAYDELRARADRVAYVQRSMTDHLAESPSGAYDAVVLLDAQDWMSDPDLNALWTQIIRTARPGARVIFRTAAEHRLLPGRLAPDLMSAWTYAEAESRAGTARDRSAIYGAFHLYRLAPASR